MASRDDDGQVILLAGILLVIAFILFSVQLSLLANLGVEAGAETTNPVLEDFLLIRRSLGTVAEDELRAANGTVMCPDLRDYALKLQSIIGFAEALESSRGQSLSLERIGVNRTQPSPPQFLIGLNVTFQITDGSTTGRDEVSYSFACIGNVPGGGGGITCDLRGACFSLPI